MRRTIRYQGAILRGDHMLLIKHREHKTGHSFWVVPGGGREAGESEEECVQREMREETNLEVEVERLLLEEAGMPGGIYKRLKTYLCRSVGGEARPGYEPETEAAAQYAISDVGWFNLQDSNTWDELARNDPITFTQLQRIQIALGYLPASALG